MELLTSFLFNEEQLEAAKRHFINLGGEMKRLILIFILLGAACAPLANPTQEPATLSPDTAVTSPPLDNMSTNEPYVNPFAPKPGDEKLSRGNIFLNEVSLVIRESYPPQVSVSLSGDLPTPCHELRAEIAAPDQENKIAIDAYSVIDPNIACTQVLKPIEEFVNLGTFESGHYSVWVNGELAGEFDA